VRADDAYSAYVIPRLGEAHTWGHDPDPQRSVTTPVLARELLGRGAAENGQSPKTGADLQRAFARVSDNLRRSLGEDIGADMARNLLDHDDARRARAAEAP